MVLGLDPFDDPRDRLIAAAAKVSKLGLEALVDEVVEPPELGLIDVGLGIHEVHAGSHPDVVVGVVVPVLDGS